MGRKEDLEEIVAELPDGIMLTEKLPVPAQKALEKAKIGDTVMYNAPMKKLRVGIGRTYYHLTKLLCGEVTVEGFTEVH
jgi:hypothetical protein